jgi:rhamnogalacturonyl hydrolase YesR
MLTRRLAGIAVLAAACLAPTARADDYWGTWEPKNDPKALGQKVVDDLIPRDLAATNYVQRGGMSYPEVCVAYGSLRFVGEIGDKERLEKLVKRYEVFFTDAGKVYHTVPNNVDNSLFGMLAMEIYRQTGGTDKKWLDLGKPYVDAQWNLPAGNTYNGKPFRPQPNQDAQAKGLSWQSRFWIDDMYMITALESEAYRVTKDKVYMDRAAKEMVAYLDALQKPNGLFYHHESSPFYWGRGNGWMAAGMAELLSIMPDDHPDRAKILDGYKKMMAALLKYQGKDGMWKQLIDKEDSWSETSGAGMFTFSMAMGVRNGWLDEQEYKAPTKKAWDGLASYLNADGKVREVCVGTNKGPSVEYYETRAKAVGDFHGQAGFIWAAWAMARTPGASPTAAASK